MVQKSNNMKPWIKACTNCANLTINSEKNRYVCMVDTSRQLSLCFDWEYMGKKTEKVVEKLMSAISKKQSEVSAIRDKLANILVKKDVGE